MQRSSGVLMPIFSLPSRYGIGTLGKEAYNFVDFLVDTKQSYWQVLPIMETSFGNSPYAAISEYAGNPFFIDFDMLREEGLLRESDYVEVDFGNDDRRVSYDKVYNNRFKILKIACDNFIKKHSIAFLKYKIENKHFIESYATFHAIKDRFGGLPFNKWDEPYKLRDKSVIKDFEKTHKDEIDFYIALQCIFYNQWFKLKKYANENGIKIIGDVPIYNAYDSVSVWAEPENYYLDKSRLPVEVAGCPPDGFTDKGQLWGNPLYNYEYIAKNDYKYFVDKFRHLHMFYDVIRIDHFRGFDTFYSIPYGRIDAVEGHWVKGPGIELFTKIKEKLGNIEIIAEDLGFLTDSVKKLLLDTGYPGMKVLEFAFNAKNKGDTNYLPHTYIENSVSYIGTHDNDTFIGWFNSLNEDDKNYAKEYLSLACDGADNYRALRAIYHSKSVLAIANPQDLLGIGSEGRINTPSTISDMNWSFRLRENEFDESVKKYFRELTEETGRAPSNKKIGIK